VIKDLLGHLPKFDRIGEYLKGVRATDGDDKENAAHFAKIYGRIANLARSRGNHKRAAEIDAVVEALLGMAKGGS